MILCSALFSCDNEKLSLRAGFFCWAESRIGRRGAFRKLRRQADTSKLEFSSLFAA